MMMNQTCLVGILALSSLLSSCSQNRKMNDFKHDYQHHAQSKYVKDNLKAGSGSIAASKKSSIKGSQPSTINNKQLARTKRELVRRKAHSASRITHTIQQNHLFIANQSLKQRVAALNGKQETENWLNNNVGLSSVLMVVLKNNLAIQSSYQEAKASLSRYDQVSFLDDTLSQYATFTKDLALPMGSKKQSKSVTGGFPFPGLLALKGSIIDQSAESSRLRLLQTVQDVITQTRIAYYELQLAFQQSVIVSKKIDLLKSLKKQLKDSYSTNTTELDNILKVDIDIEKSRNQRQNLYSNVLTQQSRLNALSNISPTFKLNKVGNLQPVTRFNISTNQLHEASKQRVEIAILESNIKKMAQIIRLSEKKFYPDFSAGYSRFQNKTSVQVGSNASKPAFSTRPNVRKRNFFGMNDAYLNETKLKYKALQLKLAALKNTTNDEVQQMLSRYQTQQRNYRLYQSKVIPKSKTNLAIAKNAFETGDISYLKVIGIQKTIFDAQLQSLNAIKGMNVNAARLDRLVGRSNR